MTFYHFLIVSVLKKTLKEIKALINFIFNVKSCKSKRGHILFFVCLGATIKTVLMSASI